jgi:predicted Zn-dependent protease with MMP-like domain
MTDGRRERLTAYRSTQRRFRPDRRQFELLVSEALADLPSEFRGRLENVAVVVEDWPGPQHRAARSGDGDDLLLGLYQGTPLTQRGTDYHLVPPDRITIFRGPILALRASRAEVLREIRDTVVHEVGHYFGLDERELR